MTPALPSHGRRLQAVYGALRERFGHQHWWPGDSPFEICVGAILTQNTAWSNVERAIRRLREACVLDPRKLHQLPEADLVELIRPAGCPRVKARRLRAFLQLLVESYEGDMARLFAGETATVRDRLLAVSGIGPETADCMLLYAGGHPSFVIDAYTRRIFSRHQWGPAEGSYEALQKYAATCAEGIPSGQILDLWQDYHAQLVAVGKHYCRPRQPRCSECPLAPWLPHVPPPARP